MNHILIDKTIQERAQLVADLCLPYNIVFSIFK